MAWVQSASKADVAALAPEVFAAWQDGDRSRRPRSSARPWTASRRTVSPAAAWSWRPKSPRPLRARRKCPAQATALRLHGCGPPSASRWPGAVVTAAGTGKRVGSRRTRPPPSDAGVSAARRGSLHTCRRRTLSLPPLQSLVRSPTERRNPRSTHLDRLPVADAVRLMLEEDRRIPQALLARARPSRARRDDDCPRLQRGGGRLFYVGAGTSGRLGVLDASECPPTFHTPPDMVQGIIAGGQRALWSAVEGAEDDAPAGGRAVGRAAWRGETSSSGSPRAAGPPSCGAHSARPDAAGPSTILLCFNPHLEVPRGQRPTLVIAPDVGPEILTGQRD